MADKLTTGIAVQIVGNVACNEVQAAKCLQLGVCSVGVQLCAYRVCVLRDTCSVGLNRGACRVCMPRVHAACA